MPKYHLTRMALADLDEIWYYTFTNWSEEQADRYYDLLIRTCHLLSHEPLIGKNYEEVFKGIQGFRVQKHIVFYRRLDDDLIEVTRILHESMDIRSKFD